jgi:hypothetical protein
VLNYHIIYEIDDIEHTTNKIDKHQISPCILMCTLVNTRSGELVDIKSILKHYDNNIPVRYFIEKNNFNDYNQIKYKKLRNSGECNIKEYIDKKLIDLFNDK